MSQALLEKELGSQRYCIRLTDYKDNIYMHIVDRQKGKSVTLNKEAVLALQKHFLAINRQLKQHPSEKLQGKDKKKRTHSSEEDTD
jgi:hypothetical protein